MVEGYAPRMATLAGHPYTTRAGWNARPPTDPFVPFRAPAARLYVHHLAAEQHGAQGMRDVQRFHQDTRGWKCIAYTYLVDDDGTIYEGRGHQWIGGATEGENSTSHAICLMGNFQSRLPTAAAQRSLVDLARHGRDAGWWVPTMHGHRDSPKANTSCPGDWLYARLPDLRHQVAAPTGPTPAPTPPPVLEDPDMIIIDSPGKPALVIGAGGVKRLTQDQRGALRSIGVDAKKVDAATSDALYSLRDTD